MKKKLYKKTNIVITGAAGFIGSHVANFFLSKNYKVIAIDNQKFGNWSNLDKKDKKIEILNIDINKISILRLKKIFNKNTILIHLAAEKHNNSLKNPKIIFETNCIATNKIFKVASELKIKKIIFSSSLYAYGSQKLPKMNEKMICSPKTVYGISKLAGEYLVRMYCDQNKIPFSILRLFFVYGPKQHTGQGYPSIIVRNFKRIKKNHRPIIVNNGKQTLDYVYIDDVVNAIYKCTRSNKSDVFNVSSGTGISINKLTKNMIKVSKKKINYIYKGSDWTKETYRVGSNSKISHKVQWKPKVNMLKGLQNVWNWINHKI